VVSVLLLVALGAGAASAVAGLLATVDGRLTGGLFLPAIAPTPEADPGIPLPWSGEALAPSALQAEGFAGAFEALLLLGLCVFAVGAGSAAVLAAQAQTARRRERGIRGLVGASPARLLTCGVAGAYAVGLAGAALALALGIAGADALLRSWPGGVAEGAPRALFPLVVVVSGGLLVSFAAAIPLLRVLRSGWLGDALAPQARTNPGLDEEAVQRVLLACQALVGVTLVYAAALLVVSQDDGPAGEAMAAFHGGSLLVLDVEAPSEPPQARRERYRSFLDEVRRLPDVEAAALASRGALGARGTVDWTVTLSRAPGVGVHGIHAEHHAVGDGWFDTLGVRIEGAPPGDGRVATNATLARFVGWSGPQGELPLRLGGSAGQPMTAAGLLAGDLPVVAPGWGRAYRVYPFGVVRSWTPPVIYVSFEDHPPERAELLVRFPAAGLGPTGIGSGEPVPEELRSALTAAAERAGLGAALPELLPDRLRRMGGEARWFGAVVTGLGVAALLLGVLGVGGAFRAGARRRIAELGLRRAVGGTRRRVVAGVLGELLGPLAVAGWFGLGTAAAAGHALTSFLPLGPRFEVELYLAALAALAAGAVLGALGPTVRAASVPPAHAIRRGEEVEGGGLV
jgi:hypothetical protein